MQCPCYLPASCQRHNKNKNSMLPPLFCFFISQGEHLQYNAPAWCHWYATKAIRNKIQIRTRVNAMPSLHLRLCHSCRTKAITNTNTNSALPLLLCFFLVMGQSYLLKHNLLSNHLDGQNIIYYQNAHKQIEKILN